MRAKKRSAEFPRHYKRQVIYNLFNSNSHTTTLTTTTKRKEVVYHLLYDYIITYILLYVNTFFEFFNLFTDNYQEVLRLHHLKSYCV